MGKEKHETANVQAGVQSQQQLQSTVSCARNRNIRQWNSRGNVNPVGSFPIVFEGNSPHVSCSLVYPLFKLGSACVHGLFRSIKLTCLEDSLDTKDPDLSGGQKRRLSLAMELLANRSILFLGNELEIPDTGTGLCASKTVSDFRQTSASDTLVAIMCQAARSSVPFTYRLLRSTLITVLSSLSMAGTIEKLRGLALTPLTADETVAWHGNIASPLSLSRLSRRTNFWSRRERIFGGDDNFEEAFFEGGEVPLTFPGEKCTRPIGTFSMSYDVGTR